MRHAEDRRCAVNLAVECLGSQYGLWLFSYHITPVNMRLHAVYGMVGSPTCTVPGAWCEHHSRCVARGVGYSSGLGLGSQKCVNGTQSPVRGLGSSVVNRTEADFGNTTGLRTMSCITSWTRFRT